MLLLGLGIVAIIVMYIIDVRQTTQTIRRNYPVIGRFRYFLEHLGDFLSNTFWQWVEKSSSLTAQRKALPLGKKSWV